ncbi:Clp protease N-terminal domain-containing protein [Streptomyces iconiensis]|uniref:Clp protease N-terminal domain-containing protein n=1 Tax=Streptomyces iconiensis TaxID=1384038 RepID=A0ABT6ZN92_9ACTN|nr:Clp protease N-terminal domain-containing protein [Streptomyces iconiensis]MDJ1130525.1 Clp protease N-terminal domain-containing protein [Streptomyces iconiensis]
MFERFSKEARAIVIGAQEEARSLGHERIGTEHLLLAALRHPAQPGPATLVRLGVTVTSCRAAVAAVVAGEGGELGPEDAEALRTLGIDLEEIRRRADSSFGSGALDAPRRGRSGHIPFAARAKKVLELSLRETTARNDRRIGTEHVVLGLLRMDDKITLSVLDRLGIVPTDVQELIRADLRGAA